MRLGTLLNVLLCYSYNWFWKSITSVTMRVITVNIIFHSQILHDVDIWAILMANMLQDVPFLICRLILMVGYRVITYTMIFFTCKNLLIIILQSYRASVIIHDRYQKASPDDDIRRLIDHYCDALIRSQRMLEELQERHTDVFDKHETDRFGNTHHNAGDPEGSAIHTTLKSIKMRAEARDECDVINELSEPLLSINNGVPRGESHTLDRKRRRNKINDDDDSSEMIGVSRGRHRKRNQSESNRKNKVDEYDEYSINSAGSGRHRNPAESGRRNKRMSDSLNVDYEGHSQSRSRSNDKAGSSRSGRLIPSISQDSFGEQIERRNFADSPQRRRQQDRRPRDRPRGSADLTKIYEHEDFEEIMYEEPRKRVKGRSRSRRR